MSKSFSQSTSANHSSVHSHLSQSAVSVFFGDSPGRPLPSHTHRRRTHALDPPCPVHPTILVRACCEYGPRRRTVNRLRARRWAFQPQSSVAFAMPPEHGSGYSCSRLC